MIDGTELLKEYQKLIEQIKTDDEQTAVLHAIAIAMPFILGVLLDIRDTVMEVKKNG